MNNVQILGRLTKEPELTKGTKNKKSYVKFTLAVPRIKKDETDFVNCIAFEKTGEVISQYLHKGNRVIVEGSLNVSSIKDNDENLRTFTTVIVNKIDFVDSIKKEDSEDNNQEELPF